MARRREGEVKRNMTILSLQKTQTAINTALREFAHAETGQAHMEDQDEIENYYRVLRRSLNFHLKRLKGQKS